MGKIADLMGRLRADWKAEPVSFDPLDCDRLIKEMRLVEKGAERGKQELPASGSSEFDDVEGEIVERITYAVNTAQERCVNHLQTYRERLGAANASEIIDEISAEAQSAATAFSAHIASAEIRLRYLAEDAQQHESELERFRVENELSRPAQLPRSILVHVAIIAVLFSIEAIPTAILLSENDTFGWMGGFVTGVLFSATLTAASLGVGMLGWRNLRHVKASRKLVGWMLTVLFSIAALLVILGLAHLRVASAVYEPEEAARVAFRTFLEAPVRFTDLKTYGMIGLALVCALVTMREGFCLDDPYPGYGRRWRDRGESREVYVYAIDKELSSLREERDDRFGEMKLARSRLRDWQNQIPIILQARKRLMGLYESHLNHVEECARRMLAAYREANKGARKTAGPRRFDSEWKLVRPDLHDEESDSAVAPTAMWESAGKVLLQGVEKMDAAYSALVEKISQISAAFNVKVLADGSDGTRD